jgi:hypothetical protein
MSRIYAVREDDGCRFLRAIKCDSCEGEITPNPRISSSGWIHVGSDTGSGSDKLEWDYCESCARMQSYR